MSTSRRQASVGVTGFRVHPIHLPRQFEHRALEEPNLPTGRSAKIRMGDGCQKGERATENMAATAETSAKEVPDWMRFDTVIQYPVRSQPRRTHIIALSSTGVSSCLPAIHHYCNTVFQYPVRSQPQKSGGDHLSLKSNVSRAHLLALIRCLAPHLSRRVDGVVC